MLGKNIRFFMIKGNGINLSSIKFESIKNINKVKFLSKTKILLFGLVKQDILCAAYALKQKRSINIFTGRGVRFAKQIIYKKTGKVSSYR